MPIALNYLDVIQYLSVKNYSWISSTSCSIRPILDKPSPQLYSCRSPEKVTNIVDHNINQAIETFRLERKPYMYRTRLYNQLFCYHRWNRYSIRRYICHSYILYPVVAENFEVCYHDKTTTVTTKGQRQFSEESCLKKFAFRLRNDNELFQKK